MSLFDLNRNQIKTGATQNTAPLGFYPARVTHTIIDDSNIEKWNLVGKNAGIGAVFISPMDKSVELNTLTFALPLFPHIKQYPLKNEIVYIASLPGIDNQNVYSSNQLYYISSINIWNHPHHNGLPNSIVDYPSSETQRRENQESIDNPNISKTELESLDLGNKFIEKENINPLKPYEGDTIFEGRFSNSIRLGSTSLNSNPWSSGTSVGSPITIIRNGQPDENIEGWLRINENINEDPSSIYLTQDQIIPISVSVKDYTSYITEKPSTPNQYSNSQIILNSDRILVNSKLDHILLSSKKSINLGAVESIVLNSTKNIVIKSNEVKLGSKNAEEPILKGDTTISILDELVSRLIELTISLQAVTPIGGPGVSQISTSILPRLNKIKVDLNTKTKSKIVKTI
jgi:hypothetical protein